MSLVINISRNLTPRTPRTRQIQIFEPIMTDEDFRDGISEEDYNRFIYGAVSCPFDQKLRRYNNGRTPKWAGRFPLIAVNDAYECYFSFPHVTITGFPAYIATIDLEKMAGGEKYKPQENWRDDPSPIIKIDEEIPFDSYRIHVPVSNKLWRRTSRYEISEANLIENTLKVLELEKELFKKESPEETKNHNQQQLDYILRYDPIP